MTKLIIKQGGQSREVPLTKDNFCIGRTPENDLEVKDSLISRRHSSIVKRGDRYIVYDLGSSNGTYVNQDRVEMRVLENGDVIRLGDTEITYVDEKAEAAKPPPATPPPQAEKKVGGLTDFAGSRYIVQHVDDIAESFRFDLTDAFSKGISLKDIDKQIPPEKTGKESRMFFILFQVGKALSTAPTLDSMIETSMKLIFDIINCERGAIMMFDRNGKDLAPRFAFHRARGVIPAGDINISKTITNQVVQEKVSIITSDALQDPRFMQGVSIVQYNIRSALCVPLWEDQKIYGVIYLDNLAKSYAFTKDDLELLTAIANLTAIRVKQEELRDRLKREENLRANLSKYHSPDVVEMLVSRGGEIGLEVAGREVTVLFADVESSTKIAENSEPAELTALLNEFFEMATTAIFQYKGHVNKFIGDEVMAIFNAPLDHPDHAAAAVKTAATILKELERRNLQHPKRTYNVRIGINTGPVVAGNVGTPLRMEYTVIGDTVNTAKRLCSFPQVNRVIIGENTWERVKSLFKANCLGETLLKGKEKALRAYEILL